MVVLVDVEVAQVELEAALVELKVAQVELEAALVRLEVAVAARFEVALEAEVKL